MYNPSLHVTYLTLKMPLEQGMVDDLALEPDHAHFFANHISVEPRVADVAHQTGARRIEDQLAEGRGVGTRAVMTEALLTASWVTAVFPASSFIYLVWNQGNFDNDVDETDHPHLAALIP